MVESDQSTHDHLAQQESRVSWLQGPADEFQLDVICVLSFRFKEIHVYFSYFYTQARSNTAALCYIYPTD